MATTIKLKNSVTTTNAPSSLVQGEVAINITDKKVWVGNAATTPIQLLGDGGSVQFTTVDTTNLQVTNIKAKDGTASASIANSTGALTVAAAFSANGGATLGDASGDALTINSSAVSIPNGLNFDSNTFVIDAANNNVGIGTSSPGTQLDVNNGSANTTIRARTGSGYSATLALLPNGSGSGIALSAQSDNSAVLYNQLNSYLAFGTNNTERMRIDSSGNVMIGTTSTSNLLHINKSTAANTFLQVQNSLAIAFYGLDASGNAYCWNQNNLPVLFGTNDLERMRITSGGDVGIGTSSPSTRLDILGAGNPTIKVRGSDAAYSAIIDVAGAGGGGGILQASSSILRIITTGANQIQFETNGSERMRITSGGRLNIGTTGGSATRLEIEGGETMCVFINTSATDANYKTTMAFTDSGGTTRGTIKVNNSATQYNTSSDYRLKENIAPMVGALSKIQALKPCTYTWKIDGHAGQGFIAHELAEIFPDAVAGEKDAVDADGKPVYQGVDTSFLVATLTAAIQEQQAMIEELKQEVSKLKGV